MIFKTHYVVRPAIYNLSFDGNQHEQDAIALLKKWGWVRVSELLDCLGHMYIYMGRTIPLMKTPNELLERFGFINGKYFMDPDWKPLITWVKVPTEPGLVGEPVSYVVRRPNLPVDEFSLRTVLFIPSGWAQNIIDLVGEGIIRVMAEGVAEDPDGVRIMGERKNGDVISLSNRSGTWRKDLGPWRKKRKKGARGK